MLKLGFGSPRRVCEDAEARVGLVQPRGRLFALTKKVNSRYALLCDVDLLSSTGCDGLKVSMFARTPVLGGLLYKWFEVQGHCAVRVLLNSTLVTTCVVTPHTGGSTSRYACCLE
jgi:hypothetical protein